MTYNTKPGTLCKLDFAPFIFAKEDGGSSSVLIPKGTIVLYLRQSALREDLHEVLAGDLCGWINGYPNWWLELEYAEPEEKA